MLQIVWLKDKQDGLLLHTFTMWGSQVASLVKFSPEVKEETVTDRWTDDRHMEGQMQGETRAPQAGHFTPMASNKM